MAAVKRVVILMSPKFGVLAEICLIRILALRLILRSSVLGLCLATAWKSKETVYHV